VLEGGCIHIVAAVPVEPSAYSTCGTLSAELDILDYSSTLCTWNELPCMACCVLIMACYSGCKPLDAVIMAGTMDTPVAWHAAVGIEEVLTLYTRKC